MTDSFLCPNCDSIVEHSERLNIVNVGAWLPCDTCGMVFDTRYVETVADGGSTNG